MASLPRSTFLVVGFMLVAVVHADGQCLDQEQKLKAFFPLPGEAMGRAVAIGGVVAASGVPNDSLSGAPMVGSVRVHRFDGVTWNGESTLKASDGAANDLLGNSVAVSGDSILAGAPYHADSGAVYVFRFDGASWSEVQTLVPPDASSGALFGWSLAVKDDVAIIGAPGDQTGPFFNTGTAYVFRRVNGQWLEEARLIAS